MPSTAEPRLRFDTFVVGAGNRAAVLAVTSVAEHPGAADSPLVIAGGVGTGKTHLLTALRQFVTGRFIGQPQLQIEPTTLAAIAADAAARAEILQRAQHAFLVTVDDVHLLAGDTPGAQLLARILDAADLAQVVVTTDQPVDQIPSLSAPLVSRLIAGVHVTIEPPDRATRAALVQAAAAEYGAQLTPVAVDEISRFAVTDARQLFGYVRRLVATQRFRVMTPPRREPTLERAGGEFEDLLVFADPEKIVWDWPELTGRLVEDVG